MMKNYLFFGGLFRLNYAYVDLYTGSSYVADSLFYRHKIQIRHGNEMRNDETKYCVIFCKIRRKDRQEFEKALAEISDKMNLLRYNDYDRFCAWLMDQIENPDRDNADLRPFEMVGGGEPL